MHEPLIESGTKSAFGKPQVVCGDRQIAISCDERVDDGPGSRTQILRSAVQHTRLPAAVLTSPVPSVHMLALVLGGVTTLDLQEADVVPNVLHTVSEPVHAFR
jgi:hypothetical protein